MPPQQQQPDPSTPPNETSAATTVAETIVVGPDLNGSRTALDHKVYRQVLLPNGIRCVLIQDTVALHAQGGGQPVQDAWGYEEEFDGESDSDDDNDSGGDNHKGNAGIDKDADDDDQKQPEEDESSQDEKSKDNTTGMRDAAAAVLVGAGSLMDPPGCQGLAHALEHFLHLGSEKYPGENDYDAYVSKYGGYDNAYTDNECTVYTMSIQQEFLFGGLDRMVQHFVSPLLDEASVERECKAVESEFHLNRNDDSVRLEQLQCATAKLGHPFNKFSWGNLESLQRIPARLGLPPLTTLLRQFFDTFYYGANMRVVVMGAYSLDVLQRRVYEIFQNVPALPRVVDPAWPVPVEPQSIASWDDAKYTSPLASMGPMFDTDRSLQKVFYVLPIKERHALTITWQLPPMYTHWASKPTDFLSHLLGHESQGSLLSHLRDREWATGCSAGMDEDSYCSFALFTFNVVLSEQGVSHWREVVKAVYFYIGLLRSYCTSEKGWPTWIHEELQQMAAVTHQFEDEESPDDFVEDLVEEMLPYYTMPAERLLDGPSLYYKFDAEEIRRILDENMTPGNARIDILSSLFGKYEDYADLGVPNENTDTIVRDLRVLPEGDFHPSSTQEQPQMEPMFGVLFWCQQISESLLQEWKQCSAPEQQPPIPVSLPPQNPFVPTRYDLKELPETDCRHALLNASIKVCVNVGKTKQWFQATVVRYNRNNNSILLSYEDEEEKWHKLDQPEGFFGREKMKPGFESSLDNRKNKFRLLVLPRLGSGLVRSFGDSDDNEENDKFPPIPPATPRTRLPKEMASSNLLRMWHLQDRNFHRPIADLRIQIISEHANGAALISAVADLMAELVNDVCTETAYLASVCESGVTIEVNCTGFELCFSGFDDKLLDLVGYVLPTFLSFRTDSDSLPHVFPESRFRASYEVLRRRYKNHGVMSSKLCRDVRLEALRMTSWSAHSKLVALESLNISTFVATASLILSSFGTEVFFHGNVTQNDAKYAKELILSSLSKSGATTGLAKKKYPSKTMLKLPPVLRPRPIVLPTKEPTDENTTVEVYIQVGKDKLRERVLLDLLVNMMDEPYYDQLRTKDQFGYDVDCDVRWSYGIMGLVFKVISSTKSADDITARIDRFLVEFRLSLVSMQDSEYMEYVVALASEKLEMFNSMSEETDSFWTEIRDGRYHWEVWRDEAIELRSIAKDDCLTAFDNWLCPDNKRKLLVVQVIGSGETNASHGRPMVDQQAHGEYTLAQVNQFRSTCKKQTWGRVTSKLC